MADSQPDIQLYNESSVEIPLSPSTCARIASSFAQNENCSFDFIELVYVDEDEIVRINKEHLDRNYVTDIITFRYDNASRYEAIEGTLFCCAPRIVEQAREFNESPEREFLRIYIHGLLHLAGYEDNTEDKKRKMTKKENAYLNVL